MKKYLLGLMLALSMFGFMYVPVKSDTLCIAGSQAEFADYVNKNNFKTYDLVPDDLVKLMKYVNNLRLSKNIFALEVDTFTFSLIDKEQKLIGTVMFKDGCVVPGTVIVVTLDDFIKTMNEAGVDVNATIEVMFI